MQRLSFFLFLILQFTVAGCGDESDSGTNSEASCSIDEDCGEETCTEGECTSPAPTGGEGEETCTEVTCGDVCCSTGEVCEAGECVVQEEECVPLCTGEVLCGDDGCGGSCGECGSGTICTNGNCADEECTPSCEGVECGPDGCGGQCGSCEEGEEARWSVCISVACVPDCTGLACGDDGCGGSCGECETGYSCEGGECLLANTCEGPWQEGRPHPAVGVTRPVFRPEIAARTTAQFVETVRKRSPVPQNPATTRIPARRMCASRTACVPTHRTPFLARTEDVCTARDECSNGECITGVPKNCSDGESCTTDTCDPELGCMHELLDCDDGDACTIGDACMSVGLWHLHDRWSPRMRRWRHLAPQIPVNRKQDA